jgi:hypothetical protein
MFKGSDILPKEITVADVGPDLSALAISASNLEASSLHIR